MIRSKKALHLLLAGAILILSSACGAQQQGAAPAPGGAAAADKAAPASAPAAPAPTERTIQHKLGETKVPADPKNIATLQPFIMDHLLSLGVTPGSGVMFGKQWPAFIANELKNTKVNGSDANPNLEAILAAGPDLIIAQNSQEKAYDALSKIAPTVVLDLTVRDWRKTFLKVAEIIGKQDKAKEVLDNFEKKAADARKKLDDSVGNESVMFLRVDNKEFRYYGIKNYRILYEDLGLQPPKDFITDDTTTYQPIALEKLAEINPDHIFLLVESEERIQQVKETAVWKNMTAAKNNHIHTVDYDLWLQGFGPIAYSKMIDEVLQLLGKK